jgi:hypothetical protein
LDLFFLGPKNTAWGRFGYGRCLARWPLLRRRHEPETPILGDTILLISAVFSESFWKILEEFSSLLEDFWKILDPF